MLMELTNLCLQVSSCKNKRQKLAHGDNSGSSDSNQISKETFSCDERQKTMVAKITDGDDEIYCWSGPPKRPRSPVKCDNHITVVQPVMRLPKRSLSNTAVKLKQQFVGPPNTKSTSDEIQSSFHQHENNKKQTSHDASTVHSSCSTQIRSGEHNNHSEGDLSEKSKLACDEDDILCWSGPPKTPRSPSKDTSSSRGHSVEKKSTTSENIPPVDPLLHVPIVTPPCPIKPKDSQMPTPLRTYTHVSKRFT